MNYFKFIRSLNSNFFSQVARISEYRSNSGLQADILLIIYSFQLCAYSFEPKEHYSDQMFSYFENFTKTVSLYAVKQELTIALCAILLVILFFIMGSLIYLAFDQTVNEGKFNIQDIQMKRLRRLTCVFLDVFYWLPVGILQVSINMIKINNRALIMIGLLTILLYTFILICVYYFFRTYSFNTRGLYRSFSYLELLRLFLVYLTLIIYNVNQFDIAKMVQSALVIVTITDLKTCPYRRDQENSIYILGLSGVKQYLILSHLSSFSNAFNEENIFLFWLIIFPMMFAVLNQLQALIWKQYLFFFRPPNSKAYSVEKACLFLELIAELMHKARNEQQNKILLLEILNYHQQTCQDNNCECSVKDMDHQKDMFTQNSNASRTALITFVDNKDEKSNLNEPSFNRSNKESSYNDKPIKYHQELNLDEPKQLIEFAKRVNRCCNPIIFLTEGDVNEERVMVFIKYTFHQIVQNFQYDSDAIKLEIVSLKYITFMSFYKQNSPAALSRLKQIQNKPLNFSSYFRRVCQVIETQLIEDVQQKHQYQGDPLQTEQGYSLKVEEIWRLEVLKDDIVQCLVSLLRKKLRLWENLIKGDSSNLDKLMVDIIDVSCEVEKCRSKLKSILSDFEKEVREQYVYFHKYECFLALFVECDYKKAATMQRRMEDAWSMSKATFRDGELGNFHWLSGNITTIEVSISLQQGQIIKGVTQRLSDFLNFKTMEEMINQLKIRGIKTRSQATNQNFALSSLMPPFLTVSHSFFIQRFLQRGTSPYIMKSIESFACDAQGFLVPIHVHLSFNFKNLNDFTMLGALQRKKQEEDFIVFDEWGRILGITSKLFNQIIIRGSLSEFGNVAKVGKVSDRRKTQINLQQNKINLAQKLAQDTNAKLFKKTITNNFNKTMRDGGRSQRRSFLKPSDILIRYGSIQHFLPQVGKQMLTIMQNEIYKQLQKDSQSQMQKYFDGPNNIFSDEKVPTKQLVRGLSNVGPERMATGLHRIALIDRQQYRSYALKQFIGESNLVNKNQPIIQDGKLTLYVPKNYNELIEYYNDCSSKYDDNKQTFSENGSVKRQNIQNKYSYLSQEQECHHIFDGEFQDFVDNKVKKYYSKVLLKEALEKDQKFLDMVRYKAMATIDMGIGGTSEQDQFIYFVCRLSNLNVMMAKRQEVLKIHLRKERNGQFEGSPELRKSLIQSQESFGRKMSKQNSMNLEVPGPPQKISSLQVNSENPSFQKTPSLQDPTKEKPKKFGFIERMRKQKEERQQQLEKQTDGKAVVSLRIPEKNEVPPKPKVTEPKITEPDREGPTLKLKNNQFMQPKNQIDSSFDSLRDESNIQAISTPREIAASAIREPILKQETQGPDQQKLEQSGTFGQNNYTGSYNQQESLNSEAADLEAPKKKANFLKKMENAMMKKGNEVRQQSSSQLQVPVAEGQSSTVAVPHPSKFMGLGFLASFLNRLNLRRISAVEMNQKDIFDQNPDVGFQEHSDESDQSQKNKEEQIDTPSGSESMSSNNFSQQNNGDDDEDEKLEEDDIKNIFEVMSQASNQQSVKSVSAIVMATNISNKSLTYMPEQALTLQLLKVLLVLLNVSALLGLMVTSTNYLNEVKVGGLSQTLMDFYISSINILQQVNSIKQHQYFPMNNEVYDEIMTKNIVYDSYNKTYYYRQLIMDQMEIINHYVVFPKYADQSKLNQQQDFNNIEDFLTDVSVLINNLAVITQYINQTNHDAVNKLLFKNSLGQLMDLLVYQHQIYVGISSDIETNYSDQQKQQSNIVVYLLVAFIISHLIVILFIVPYIRQINQIYTKVLCTVSRITVEECQDEMKKLTLCQHLLETEDESWVTQNHVKLVFYNKSKELNLMEKYRNQATRKNNYYFALRLSDSKLTIWKDLTLYLLISGLSIAYLIFAVLMLQSEANVFNPYVDFYNRSVFIKSHMMVFMAKLSITPERYVPLNYTYGDLQSQTALWELQQKNQLSDLLSSMDVDSKMIGDFNSDMSIFFENLNLQKGYSDSNDKTSVNQLDFQNRNSKLQQLNIMEYLNHLIKDNLCYYSTQDICTVNQQVFFNTGLLGAIDMLHKLYLDRDAMLQSFNTLEQVAYWNWTTGQGATLSNYYNSEEYINLVQSGYVVIIRSFQKLLDLMNTFLENERNTKSEQIGSLYLGIGIPLVLITLVLATMEFLFLRNKVHRVMFSLTFLPTFKFQDKIILSLIKSILKI